MGYDPLGSVRAFHQAFDVARFIEKDATERYKMARTRLTLIREEFHEVADELLDVMNGRGNRAKLAKELADLLYVVYGTADVFEIPLDKVFDAVHTSNMSKLDKDGKPIRREDGKVLKGPDYKEPDIDKILFEFE